MIDNIYIYIYIMYSEVMKTIQCAHPPHLHDFTIYVLRSMLWCLYIYIYIYIYTSKRNKRDYLHKRDYLSMVAPIFSDIVGQFPGSGQCISSACTTQVPTEGYALVHLLP